MNMLTSIARQIATIYPENEASAMARLILEDRFHLSLTDIASGKGNDLSSEDKEELQNIVARLLRYEPLQYVLGTTLFCGHTFAVNSGCLIPRPETEDMVQEIIDEYASSCNIRTLDIGTGSGCIAVSLALSGSNRFNITAWDVSREALDIARLNSERLGGNVLFEQKDILTVTDESQQWDVIVSNPPYICHSESKGMERNVIGYEPHLALFVPDDNPLVFYQSIGKFAISHLTEGGALFLEINRRFGEECKSLLRNFGFVNIELRKDRFDNDRIIKCKKP